MNIEKFRFHRYLDDTSWYEFESVEVKPHSLHRKRQAIQSFLMGLGGVLKQVLQDGLIIFARWGAETSSA